MELLICKSPTRMMLWAALIVGKVSDHCDGSEKGAQCSYCRDKDIMG